MNTNTRNPFFHPSPPLTLRPLPLLLILLVSGSHVTRGDAPLGSERGGGSRLFASSAELRLLAARELTLLDATERYVLAERARLDSLESSLASIRDQRFWQKEGKTQIWVEPGRGEEERRWAELGLIDNPLATLRLIERFVTDWQRVYIEIETSPALVTWREERSSLDPYLPSTDDLEGALLQLMRLQETYGLLLSELAEGRVGGRALGPPLSQASVVQAALVALKFTGLGSNYVELSIDWLRCALNHAVEPLSTPEQIYHGLARAFALNGDYSGSFLSTQAAIEADPTNAVYYVTHILPPAEQMPVLNVRPSFKEEYCKLCREPIQQQLHHLQDRENETARLHSQGKIVDTTAAETDAATAASAVATAAAAAADMSAVSAAASAAAALKCSYKTTALRPYAGYKTELLHHSPDVLLFHDVITDSEAATLLELATNELTQAMVGASTNSKVSYMRTGKIAWLHDNHPSNSTTLARVNAYIADAAGLNVLGTAAEPLQMSNYGLGGQYETHHDTFRYYDRNEQDETLLYYNKGTNYAGASRPGDRIATFMIYMNEVLAGGATVFPALGLTIFPIKNAGILWFNMLRSGLPDRRFVHAGCPVLLGHKWVANKWIHEGGQVFTRPCGLDPAV